MLIGETHFTDTSFNVPNYSTYFTNHPDNTVHAGTDIIIKKSISHYELSKFESAHLQTTVIKVKMLPYELTVAFVYCPP